MTSKRKKLSMLVLAGALLLVAFYLSWQSTPSAIFKDDPTLVRTTNADYFVFPDAGGFNFRMLIWKWYSRISPPKVTYTFGPSNPTNNCSIHGMLNQCHHISNVQFLIDKNIAAGTIIFGTTNTLTGDQWLTAFTNALQTGKVAWFDPAKKTFRSDNPAFLPLRPDLILVLPPERVPEYSK